MYISETFSFSLLMITVSFLWRLDTWLSLDVLSGEWITDRAHFDSSQREED